MAYADPQSVTVNAIPISMPRTSSGTNAGAFTSNDGGYKLSVSHTYGKRTRRLIRLDNTKIVADPIFSGNNLRVSAGCYLVVDAPISGYSPAELKLMVDGFLAALTASSGAKITQLLGGEN